MFTCGKCKVWPSKAAIGTVVASVDNLAWFLRRWSNEGNKTTYFQMQTRRCVSSGRSGCGSDWSIRNSVSFGEQSIQHHPTSSNSQFLFASFIGESKPKMPRNWKKWNRNRPEMEHIGAQWKLSTVRHQVFRWTHDHLCDLRGSESCKMLLKVIRLPLRSDLVRRQVCCHINLTVICCHLVLYAICTHEYCTPS